MTGRRCPATHRGTRLQQAGDEVRCTLRQRSGDVAIDGPIHSPWPRLAIRQERPRALLPDPTSPPHPHRVSKVLPRWSCARRKCLSTAHMFAPSVKKGGPIIYQNITDCPTRTKAGKYELYGMSKAVRLSNHTNFPRAVFDVDAPPGEYSVLKRASKEIRRSRHCLPFSSSWYVHLLSREDRVSRTGIDRLLNVGNFKSDLLRHASPVAYRIFNVCPISLILHRCHFS